MRVGALGVGMVMGCVPVCGRGGCWGGLHPGGRLRRENDMRNDSVECAEHKRNSAGEWENEQPPTRWSGAVGD